MNIVYIPGAENSVDMSEYIKRGTNIDMEAHKIVNCAEGSADDDVVTIRGLAAYYRRGSPLNMQGAQIRDLAPGSSENDAVTLGQCTALLRKYDADLSRSLSQLSDTAAAGGKGPLPSSAGSSLAGAASGVAAGTGSSLIGGLASSSISTLSGAGTNIVTGVGGIFVAQLQRLTGRFVAKPISEDLDMTEHKIVNVADGSENRDAVNFRQLSQYVTTTAADAKYIAAANADSKYLTLASADARYATTSNADAKYATRASVPSTADNDARYVTRSALYELNYLNKAELPQRVAALIEEAQTRTKAAIEARADNMYVQTGATQSVDMQRHRIRNLPNSPRAGDAVSYELLLEHSVKTLYRVKEGEIQLNRENIAIVMKSNNGMLPLALHVSAYSVYVQQPFVTKTIRRNSGEQLANQDPTLFVMYTTVSRNVDSSRYRLTYFVIDFNFREMETTQEERAAATFQ